MSGLRNEWTFHVLSGKLANGLSITNWSFHRQFCIKNNRVMRHVSNYAESRHCSAIVHNNTICSLITQPTYFFHRKSCSHQIGCERVPTGETLHKYNVSVHRVIAYSDVTQKITICELYEFCSSMHITLFVMVVLIMQIWKLRVSIHVFVCNLCISLSKTWKNDLCVYQYILNILRTFKQYRDTIENLPKNVSL